PSGQPGYDPYPAPQPPGYDSYGQPEYGQPEYGQPGYAPQSYGQQAASGMNPYQQPGYGAYQLPNHPQATTALILGIVGLVFCPFVGIAGLVLGGRARKEIDAAPGQWGGRGIATAGWVLGIISIVYLAFLVVFVIIGVAGSAGF
ncbi:MAG: DUF4190 domain-containing protein, partial [Microlunatus sp.]|nr:DUF4190 domain-containing protein [Microlunatus sp.]